MSNPIYIAKESTLCEVKTAVGSPAEGSSLATELSAIKTSIGAASGQTVMGKLGEISSGNEWIYTTGDTLLKSLTHAVINTTDATDAFLPQKLTMGMGGTLTVKATVACILSSGTVGSNLGKLKIYVNDALKASVDFSNTEATEISLDVTFEKGDELKIAVYKTNGSTSKFSRLYANSVKIYGNVIPKAAADAIALSAIS